MVGPMSKLTFSGAPSRRRSAVAVAAVAILTAGCSADITRFDSPVFGLSDTPDSTSRSQSRVGGGSSLFDQQDASGQSAAGGGIAAGGNYSRPDARANFDPAPQATRTAALSSNDRSRQVAAPTQRYEQPSSPPPVRTYGARQAELSPAGIDGRPTASPSYSSNAADRITVVPGDTLYGLSRRHGTTVDALMDANGLTSTTLRPGQELELPFGANPAPASSPRRSSTPPTSVAETSPAPAPRDWNGSYEIAAGDSLYKISRQYNVSASELQRYNGIDDPRRIRIGTVLKVPGNSGVPAADPPRVRTAAVASEQETRRDANARIFSAPPSMTDATPSRPAIINGSGASRTAAPAPQSEPRPVKTARIAPPASSVDASKTRLRWPVRGRILSGFGRRPDGTHNDGVNVAVPKGTDVVAAEDGVVAYAGSELRGYGNLILIRHENGWVTAYAHNDKLLVKRGDKVKRGGVIAKAGQTGEVDTPQVHFELRQGSKPVDPMPYLAAS